VDLQLSSRFAAYAHSENITGKKRQYTHTKKERKSNLAKSFLVMVKEIVKWKLGKFWSAECRHCILVHNPLWRQKVPQTRPVNTTCIFACPKDKVTQKNTAVSYE